MTGNTAFSRQGHHSKGSKRLVFHIISWGKLSPVSYSRSMRGSRLHITFTQHRFQDWSVQVFLSGWNEFVYWAKVGHATHTCWKHWHSKEPVFICFKSCLYTIIYYKTWMESKTVKHANYYTLIYSKCYSWCIFAQLFVRKSVLKKRKW